jgi:hypothetical protein
MGGGHNQLAMNASSKEETMGLSRRSFLRSAAILGAVGPAMAKASFDELQPKKVDKLKGELYRGYDVWWTGWKPAQGVEFICGQIVAYPVGPAPEFKYVKNAPVPHLVSVVPGGQHSPFAPGACFDLCLFDRNEVVSVKTTEEQKEMLIAKGKRRVFEMIDCIKDSGLQNRDLAFWDEFLTKNMKGDVGAYLRGRVQGMWAS